MMHQFVARFHCGTRRAARLVGLLLLAALGPACYSSKGHNYMAPAGPGGMGVLFSDTFFPYPNASKWSAATASDATAAEGFDGTQYFVQMKETARPGNVSITSVMSFSFGALTFKVDFRPSTGTSADADQAMIQIVDSTAPATVLAQAVYDASTGKVTFSIGATSFPAVALTVGAFQTLSFVVDAGLGGTWMLGATSEGNAAFGTHSTKLTLASTFPSGAAASPTFDFTNVVVSSP
jgi:hypothetical protein